MRTYLLSFYLPVGRFKTNHGRAARHVRENPSDETTPSNPSPPARRRAAGLPSAYGAGLEEVIVTAPKRGASFGAPRGYGMDFIYQY